MAAPYWQYQTIYSTGNEPDIGLVNVEAQNGWQLVQIMANRPDWAYVLCRLVRGGPARAKTKKKKKK